MIGLYLTFQIKYKLTLPGRKQYLTFFLIGEDNLPRRYWTILNKFFIDFSDWLSTELKVKGTKWARNEKIWAIVGELVSFWSLIGQFAVTMLDSFFSLAQTLCWCEDILSGSQDILNI